MPRLTKQELLNRILPAIRAAGWNVIFVTHLHPYDLVIVKDEQTFPARLYIWNVTHGGGSVRAPTEFRIQVTGVSLPLTAPHGFQTLLFGWYEDLGVIAAFDPERHRRPSAASPSIQISINTMQDASRCGLAVQERGNQEIALAFRPEMLITYIENQYALHGFAGSQHDIELLVQAGGGSDIPAGEFRSVPAERGRVIRMVSIRRREATFRARILQAYNYSCAVCCIQLELVEAAHIVPVGAPGSTDETANGISLCALHHEAYDNVLVGIRPDYRVIINEDRMRALRSTRRGAEEQRFRNNLQTRIILPVTLRDRPRQEYLREGLRIRGWSSN
jgi:putative restriction endonuclease